MMAIAVATHSAMTVGTPAVELAVPAPAGIQRGDLLLAFYGIDFDGNDSDMYAPGWDSIYGPIANSSSRIRVLARVANGSEPSSFVFGGSATSDARVSVLRLIGAERPRYTFALKNAAEAGTSLTAPAITAPNNGVLLTCWQAIQQLTPTAWAVPNEMTPRGATSHETSWLDHMVASQDVTAGSQPAKTATTTPSLDQRWGYIGLSVVVSQAPQPAYIIERSINGVAKPHPAGATLAMKPEYYAL